MKTSRDIIELLGIESEDVTTSLPSSMVSRLLECGRRRYGSKKRQALLAQALAYAAIVGLLSWEGQYTKKKDKKK